MTNLIRALLLALVLITPQLNWAQCNVLDNFQNFGYYDLTPTTQGTGGTQTSYATWGGDYHKVDVVNGETYEISTCNSGPYVPNTPTTNGGWTGVWPTGTPFAGQIGFNRNWNPQMTLVSGTTGNIIGYNDDYCGDLPAITYTADFTGELYIVFDSSGVCDQFETDTIIVDVTWLVACTPTSSTTNQTACGSYAVPSGHETYTTSGTYMDTIPNAAGCDSVITINLTINPLDDASFSYGSSSYCSDEAITSPTITGLAGGTFTSSPSGLSINGSSGDLDPMSSSDGTYTITYTTNGTCPNTANATVSINSPTTSTDTQTACDSFTWIDGNTYTSSNSTATHTLTNAAGCDSVVTLNLTINNSNTGVDTHVACDSFTWIDGNTYTSSNNTATHTLTNAAGCDSVVTLNLTINNSSTGIDTQVACDSYTWIDGNTYTSSNNTATHTISGGAANGCDSTVTLNLIINTSSTGTDTQTVCDSLVWIDGNTYTSSNSTATHTITNGAANGCDSIVTLNLTVVEDLCPKPFATSSFSNANGTGIVGWFAGATETDWLVIYGLSGFDPLTDGDTVLVSTTPTVTINGLNNCTEYDAYIVADCGSSNSCLSLPTTFTTLGGTTSTDTQVACDSFTWIDGNTYTVSNNTATHTLTNAAGCDSVVTLNLTINNSNTGTDTQVACDSFTWIDGNTYTASNNTATHTLTNAAGCDSVVTLNLTINNSNTGTDTQVACDAFTWIDGNTYTASNNTATHTLTNAAGCDSVVTLNLTINNSNTGIDTQMACDSFTWIDGNTYTASNNTATHTLTNAAGCDSVVTLDLTINYANTGTDTQTACDSFTWIDGNTYTASNNTATHTLTNVAGCDSIVTLDLTILNSTTHTLTDTVCDSYTVPSGDETYTMSGTYMDTIPNAMGCDSIITIELTVNHSVTTTDTQVVCDSLTWIDGITYTASNDTATFVLTTVDGCDSTIVLDLTVNSVDPTATLESDNVTITATASGANYTWIDCATGNIIAGATSQSYTATENGEYAVIVTENNCTDTSECIVVNSVGIQTIDFNENMKLYPNPTQGNIHLVFDQVYDVVNVTISNVHGQKVDQQQFSITDAIEMQIEGETGVYFVEITINDHASTVLRVIKE